MQPPRVHITTYGCQMNQLDAELVAEVLRGSGALMAEEPAAADVLLFVTCSVRAHAENRVFSNIGKLAGRKKREPGLVIGLLGCMAQEHGPALRQRAPLVDIVCAPGRLAELPALIAEARAGRRAQALDPARVPRAACPPVSGCLAGTGGQAARGTPVKESADDAVVPFNPQSSIRNPQLASADAALDAAELRRPLGPGAAGQAFVVAMRGCDNFCTYCVVPFVRGPERSRPPASILEEVRRLVGQGARQVTLLGQAVNQYRAEEGGRTWDLADLLAEAAQVPGLARLSFITSHPRAMDEKLARVFRDIPRVSPYLHMPAQSGSDAVLGRMNRGYTAAEYLDRVALVRALRPGMAVASDFIVGFPGESEADFQATVALVRCARFSQAFVFKYSPRPGTLAARRFEDDVPDAVKRRRNNDLLAVVEEVAGEENRKFVGRTVRVFVEELAPRPKLNITKGDAVRVPLAACPPVPPDKKRTGGQAARGTPMCETAGNTVVPLNPQLRGRAPTNHIVVFNGPPALVGTEVDVWIESSSPLTLFGTWPSA
jgi:tRNA-2-methylthio-N6-dimethylallyladenosine synthase